MHRTTAARTLPLFTGVWMLVTGGGTGVAAPVPADMVLVPAGEFVMGSDRTDTHNRTQEFGSKKPWYADERPQRRVFLESFYIDRYEVTNEQYRRFVKQSNYWVPVTWEQNGYLLTRDILDIANVAMLRRLAVERFDVAADTTTMDKRQLLDTIEKRQAGLDDLPVSGVAWSHARDYCHWAGKRLPTEAEWEKAARGPDGREFPWGNEWEPARLNAGEGVDWQYNVAPVTEYAAGKSPYGVYQMAGNVMEWVMDSYQPYPGSSYRSDAFQATNKVVRGGGWGGMGHYAISHLYRAAYRFYLPQDSTFDDLGFRCARDAR